MNDRTRIDSVYQTFRETPGCEKAAKEALMSFAADVLMCGSDQQKVSACIGNALHRALARGEVRAYADQERLLTAFPFLRQGDAA